MKKVFASTFAVLALAGCSTRHDDPDQGKVTAEKEEKVTPKKQEYQQPTPFITLKNYDTGSTVDLFEITSQRNPNIRCVVAVGVKGAQVPLGNACFPAGEPNAVQPQWLHPFVTMNSGTEKGIVTVYEVTPPSNRNISCTVATDGDVNYASNAAISCFPALNGPN